MIEVAVGILINASDEVLIAQRPAHTKYGPGLWEFPGGKVEPNETHFAALQREFQEEVGVKVLSADHWFQIQHDYSNRSVLLDNWLIRQYEGKPHGAEGQIIRWVPRLSLQEYQFPDGNKQILLRLMQSSF